MENTTMIKRTLWMNVIFTELCAFAAIFFEERWKCIEEFTAGHGVAMGIELLLFSCLLTYAALKKKTSKSLLGLIIGLDSLLFVYFVVRLLSSADLSGAGMEMMVIDSLALLGMIIVLTMAIRAHDRQQRITLAS